MTKSRVIWDQGCPEVGRDLNKSAGGELEDLFWLQTDYIETFTDIQEKAIRTDFCRREIVRFLPEWHVNLVVCPLNYLRLKSK